MGNKNERYGANTAPVGLNPRVFLAVWVLGSAITPSMLAEANSNGSSNRVNGIEPLSRSTTVFNAAGERTYRVDSFGARITEVRIFGYNPLKS